MAIGMYFAPQGMSADKYDEVIQKLQGAGHGAPAGRTYHAAFKGEGGLHVFDVWDSQESFEAFGEALMPILAEAGVDPGEPMISDPQHHQRLTAAHAESSPADPRPRRQIFAGARARAPVRAGSAPSARSKPGEARGQAKRESLA